MTTQKRKTALITGITGQDGAYLARLLVDKNYSVTGTTRSDNPNLSGLRHLDILDKIAVEKCDLTNQDAALRIIQKYNPHEVYNLTGQSSVGLSFKEPSLTAISNILPTLNLLEAIRTTDKNIRFYQASSSDMFGKAEKLPVREESPFRPISPYAVSKVSAHLITVSYREAFGLFSVSGIMFNHESYLRENNFFIKKIIRESLAILHGEQDVLRVGDVNVKRDFGFAPEYVRAMWLMLQKNTPEDFLICSGKSILLRDIIEYVFKKFNIPIEKLIEDKKLFRPADILDMYGDNTKARQKLDWHYDMDFFEALDMIIAEEVKMREAK